MSNYRIAQKAYHPSRLNVLVAASDGYNRMLMREVLRSLNIGEIHVASTPKEAAIEIIERKLSAVLLDENLGESTGLEFTKRVRTELPPQHREVSIIIITSLTRRQDVDVARNAGIDEIIAKPMTTAAVNSRLEAVVLNPRQFVVFPSYIGPCRRRKPLSPDFQGVLRRLSDPLDAVQSRDEEVSKRTESMKQSMTKVQDLLNSIAPGVVLPVRQVYAAAQETYVEALALKDVLLERCTKSLVSYVEANGAARPLDNETVAAHVHAIIDLVRSPLIITKEREMVTEGLEKLVTKKLKEAARAGSA
ncbi:response regulator [bacterium]|nr:response regulator [bacterium]